MVDYQTSPHNKVCHSLLTWQMGDRISKDLGYLESAAVHYLYEMYSRLTIGRILQVNLYRLTCCIIIKYTITYSGLETVIKNLFNKIYSIGILLYKLLYINIKSCYVLFKNIKLLFHISIYGTWYLQQLNNGVVYKVQSPRGINIRLAQRSLF